MTVEIEIIDRVFYGLEDFCSANGLDVKEYMSDAIMEKYNLDKYGDLNEKLVKKVDIESTKTDENKKKAGRTKKIKEEEINNEQDIVPQTTEDRQTEPKEEETRLVEKPVVESVSIETNGEPVKKIRRTLKTK